MAGLSYSIAVILVQFVRGFFTPSQADVWERIEFFVMQYFLPSFLGIVVGVASGICASRLFSLRVRLNANVLILLSTLALALIQIAVFTFNRSPYITKRVPTIVGVTFGFSVIHVVFSWAVTMIVVVLSSNADRDEKPTESRE
ncbi:MAG: hypothetical protein AAGI63_02765 [Planctomycetota bacterium]